MSDDYIWTEDMSVGVEAIDRDHQWLFMVINEVDSLADTDLSQKAEKLHSLLYDFLSYTSYHFKREELLMEACEYPFLDNHREVHNFLKESVVAFVDASKQGFSDVDFDRFRSFQKNWWRDHILGMDKNYESWLRARPEIVKGVNLDFAQNVQPDKSANQEKQG